SPLSLQRPASPARSHSFPTRRSSDLQEVYEKIRQEFGAFATRLSIPDLTVIPISALEGDNVVIRSENMPWYEGTSLLHHLENVRSEEHTSELQSRFELVCRLLLEKKK